MRRYFQLLKAIIFLVFLALPPLLVLARSASAPAARPADTALLIVDIQNFYFPGGLLPLQGSEAASLKAKSVLEAFRALHYPVIHVRHISPGKSESDPQHAFHPNVRPNPNETIITKHFANSFRETNLLAVLKELNIRNLVICGMQTHLCLEAAARAAADLGFIVTVVHNACATRDLEFNGKKIPAEQAHAAALAALKGTYARVMTSEELIAEMTGKNK